MSRDSVHPYDPTTVASTQRSATARAARRIAAVATLALGSLGIAPAAVSAQDAATRVALGELQAAPTGKKDEKKPEFLPEPSLATSVPQFADPGGTRSALYAKGIKYNLLYIGEFLGNFNGGMRQGAIGEGRLQLLVDIDMEKLAGWKGGMIHLDGQYIHGEGLSRYYIGNQNVVSSIEALASTRLYDAYFEQQLIEGKLSVRAGQLAADSQFIISSYGSLYINSTFGFPQFVGSNLPAGGPGYPLATPGISTTFTPTDTFTVLAAVYNGDPADPRAADPQKANRHGIDFRLQDPPLVLAEGQYKYNTDKDSKFLPGTVKVGGYYSFLRFPLGVFQPALPLRDRGGPQGIYGIVDQQVYRLSSDEPDKGIGVFVRTGLSPSDRSLIDIYVDGGVNFIGLVPDRPGDVFGIAGAYNRFSKAARDQDLISRSSTPGYPIRSFEGTLEATYLAQVVPGFALQPTFQYAFNPSGRIPNPRDPRGRIIRDAAIFGLRVALNY